MKKILIMVLCIVTLHASAQVKQATLQASGLTCAMCSKSIYSALQKLPFTQSVTSNIKESSFTINFKPGVPLEFDALQTAVEDAGFSVAKLKLKINFDEVAISNDAHVMVKGRNLHFVDVKQQVLSGEKIVQLVDRKFVSDKEFKKYAALTKMKCITTGTMQACCAPSGMKKESRIYHVTI